MRLLGRLIPTALQVVLLATFALQPAAAETIAVIGTGNVGGTLGPAFAAQGHTIVYGAREPDRSDVVALVERTGFGATARQPADAVVGADLVLIAVPGSVAVDVVRGWATSRERSSSTQPIESAWKGSFRCTMFPARVPMQH